MSRLYIPFLIAMFMLACHTAPPTDRGDEEELEKAGRSDQQDLSLEQKVMLLPNRWVSDKEFKCVTGDLHRHIKIGPIATPSPMSVTPPRFTVSSFLTAIDSCGCPGYEAVAIHNGLDAQDRFVVALEFMCLTSVPNGYNGVSKGYYTVNNGALVAGNGSISNWKQHWNNYHSRVIFLDEIGGAWRTHQVTKDTEYVVYPFPGELRHLITHNSPLEHLEIWPSAEPSQPNDKEFRQGFVWIPVGVTLGNGPPPGPNVFHQRGADLGSQCPDLCPPKAIQFPINGLPLRSGC